MNIAAHRQEIKTRLLDGLGRQIDPVLTAEGFSRGSNHLVALRRDGAMLHRIRFVQFFDRRTPLEVWIQPFVWIENDQIGEVVTEMLDGELLQVANCPGLLMNQQLVMFQRDKRRRWILNSAGEVAAALDDIRDEICNLLPLLNELRTLEGFAAAGTRSNDRILRQDHWYVKVAAAYSLLGRADEAIDILRTKLRTPSAIKRFSTAFAYLEARRT